MPIQISGTNARFLATDIVLSEIMRVMEPNLAFLDVIPYVDSGGLPVTYGIQNTKTSDPKKQTPRMRTPSSKFAEVEITRMTKATVLTTTEGLQIRFDESALRLPSGRDMIMDAFQRVGFWMAENMNTNIYTVLRAGGTDASITPTAVWSGATATPFEDLRQFKNAMKREGYPYRMSDIYIEMANFNELEGYLANVDITDAQRMLIYGKPAMGQNDTINIPLVGNVHGLFSGITHGDLFGIDATNKTCASLYYYNDPNFETPANIAYETVVNGATTVKNVPNFGLSSHQYVEDDTHDTIVQLWVDTVVAVKDAYGILYDNGI